jgi:S-formylglutathione hydrolase FrmB
MPQKRTGHALLLLALVLASGAGLRAEHVFFRVNLSASAPAPVNGRLLVFLKKGHGDKDVNVDEFHPEATWVAAREIQALNPGQSVEIDADEIAYPQPFSQIPRGDYEAQAVLDVGHSYNYRSRRTQDWISGVVPLKQWPDSVEASLTLDHHPSQNQAHVELMRKAMENARDDVAKREDFTSPALTRFWGHDVAMKAWVILPPGYATQTQEHYPAVYWTHGFGGDIDSCLLAGLEIHHRMQQGKMPPMIWVMLDESIPEGTHEFADSVNNGPWGAALTTEFIPYLEHKYRMDAQRDGRFLNGHSSGGWATLQLEINYPAIFGGTWSTSPDPSDFHNFTGPDLYAPGANVYTKPDGSPWPIMRDHGKVLSTFQQFARLESVLGPYGGQITSFDWVFSPKGAGGAPEPMFNRETGAVNPQVAAYWRDHYDLAHIVEANWAARGADLKGRIHVFVGTADTFYLDGAAHLLDAVLNRLGAQAQFTYLPDKTHFDVYQEGQDKEKLFDRISAEMYAVARPGKQWKSK